MRENEKKRGDKMNTKREERLFPDDFALDALSNQTFTAPLPIQFQKMKNGLRL